jgi:hypothetical protein
MKKIFLLFTIFISALAASAQTSISGNENSQAKNSQIASAQIASDGIIDNLTVYPNPVVDVLKITFKSSRKSMVVISLFNNIGKQVYSEESEVETGNNIVSIDIRSKAIEPGIYFVKCVAEKDVFTRKLIVK